MDSGKKIKILIVDDHDMVRYGLSILLQTFADFEVIGHLGDPRMLLTFCNGNRPDVILMDILMPGMNGVTATQLIREKYPEIQVVALSSSADETLVEAVLKAGAISYLMKTGSVDDLAEAIRAAAQGTPTLAAEATHALIANIYQPNTVGHNLSKQELRVLALLVEGYTNQEIAERLVVSQSTVKAHVGSILSKLNTHSRTKAIAIAIRSHLLADVEKPV